MSDLAENLRLLSRNTMYDDPAYRHRGGLSYLDAPLPRRWHRCKTQTTVALGFGTAHRCACGGYRQPGRRWTDRNSRRNPPSDLARRIAELDTSIRAQIAEALARETP